MCEITFGAIGRLTDRWMDSRSKDAELTDTKVVLMCGKKKTQTPTFIAGRESDSDFTCSLYRTSWL